MANCNERIQTYVKPKLIKYFYSEEEFLEYFDLFEYIVGLIYLDIKNEKKWDIDFSLYGLRYWKYSGKGRQYSQPDTVVHKFIDDILTKGNKEFLEAGFFGKDIDRLKIEINIYHDFLMRISN